MANTHRPESEIWLVIIVHAAVRRVDVFGILNDNIALLTFALVITIEDRRKCVPTTHTCINAYSFFFHTLFAFIIIISCTRTYTRIIGI